MTVLEPQPHPEPCHNHTQNHREVVRVQKGRSEPRPYPGPPRTVTQDHSEGSYRDPAVVAMAVTVRWRAKAKTKAKASLAGPGSKARREPHIPARASQQPGLLKFPQPAPGGTAGWPSCSCRRSHDEPATSTVFAPSADFPRTWADRLNFTGTKAPANHRPELHRCPSRDRASGAVTSAVSGLSRPNQQSERVNDAR